MNHMKLVPGGGLAFSDTIEEFERCMAEQPIWARPWQITPELATHILKKYNKEGNRSPHARRFLYAEAIKAGKWPLTGQTIIMAWDRTLLDGQNRLMACADTGISFPNYVVFGIDPAVFPYIDRNKPRSAGDNLKIMGIPNWNHAANTLRWLYLIKVDRVKNRDSFEPDEIKQIYELSDKELVQEGIRYGSRLRKAYPSDKLPIGITAAFYYHATKANPALASEFFDAFAMGKIGGRFSPIDKMLRRVRQEKERARGKFHEPVRIAYLVTAWNLVSANRAGAMTSFDWETTDRFPVISGGAVSP